MKLSELLNQQRSEFLDLCLEKLRASVGVSNPSSLLEIGLPALFDDVAAVIGGTSENLRAQPLKAETRRSSRLSAQEAYTRGYTVAQLIGSYGAICQGITLHAARINATVTTHEFSRLNLWLDGAIAQAVTEYQQLIGARAVKSEAERLGTLVHDLRNALAGAILAHDLIKMGEVGAAGATSQVLTEAHLRMKDLIDRSVAQVRLGDVQLFDQTEISVLGLLSDVESALIPEAFARSVQVIVHTEPSLRIFADRHLITAAISNMAQNAVKFTKIDSRVWIRAFAEGDAVVIEVEDECGGIPEGTITTLFEPYVQVGKDRSGLGLGLGIARKAAELNGGTIRVESEPGHGCIFSLRLPNLDTPPAHGPKKN